MLMPVSDDVVRGFGLVLPIPEGWEFQEHTATQGSLVVYPVGPEADEAFLLALPAVEAAWELDDAGFDEMLDVVREGVPVPPDRDDAVDLDGAVEARVLEYEALEVSDAEGGTGRAEGSAQSHVLILAESAEGSFALWQYVADEMAEDPAIGERLLAEAGFDPDGDPAATSDR